MNEWPKVKLDFIKRLWFRHFESLGETGEIWTQFGHPNFTLNKGPKVKFNHLHLSNCIKTVTLQTGFFPMSSALETPVSLCTEERMSYVF